VRYDDGYERWLLPHQVRCGSSHLQQPCLHDSAATADCVEVGGAVSVPVCDEVPPEATADCVEVGGAVSVPVSDEVPPEATADCVEVGGAVSVPVCDEVPPEATADCVEVDGVVSVPVCGDVGLSTVCKFSGHFTHIYAAAVVAIGICVKPHRGGSKEVLCPS